MPDVSVIVPSHNRGELLRRAISSVLGQTLQELEILVVDDASEDNTEEIVTSLTDERIRYIRHETNRGVAAARNTGLLNSTGKYIAFLDDDDEWLPEKIERQFALLEKSPESIGVVYTGWIGVDAASGRILYQRTPNQKGDIFKFLLVHESLAPTSSLLLRRECFEKCGLFDVEFDYGEDFDMWLRIAQLFQFDYIEEALLKYSVPNENKSSLSSNYEARIKASEAQLKKYAAIIALDSRRLSRRYFDLGVLNCYAGKIAKGRRTLLKAIKVYPFEPKYYFNLSLALLGANSFKKLKKLKERAFAGLVEFGKRFQHEIRSRQVLP